MGKLLAALLVFLAAYALMPAQANREPVASFETVMRDVYRSQDAFQPSGAVVFVGDSLTQRLATNAVASTAVNYGIGGQTTYGLAETIGTYGAVKRARLVVLTIGTNDVLKRRAEGIEARLRAISEAIDKPLVWNAIPPNPNGDADAVNDIARRICAERADCVFLDPRFTHADIGKDNIHLNERGYTRWIAALRKEVK